MIAAGIDIGSVSTKVALSVNNKNITKVVIPTGWSPRQAGEQALASALEQVGEREADFVVATGYGRIALPTANKTVTEITCHARGVANLVPETRIIIDIGGQDSKIIKIGEKGRIIDFIMNDKCAAGTGRFMEVIAARLGIDVADLSDLAENQAPVELNSMCTVFAESEVVGLLAKGISKGEIIAGLNRSITRRISTMLERLNPSPPVVFTGGLAKNMSLTNDLSKEINMPVNVPQDCQFTGAIGAMLLASEMV